jgi:hypothetical protein
VSVREVLSGAATGVFHLDDDVDHTQDAALDSGWHVVVLDTSDVTDKKGFMAVAADAFGLPESFAQTWEALDGHLRVLDLDDPDGLLVLWHGWGEFAEADPDSFEVAIEVFQDATVAWRDDEFDGAVFLVGDGPETDLSRV